MKIISNVIEKLYNMTKDGKIEWLSFSEYISEHHNEALRKYVLKSQKSYYNTPYIREDYAVSFLDEQRTYVSMVNGGIITLVAYSDDKDDYYVLIAQRTPSSRVVELNVKEEFQEKLNMLNIIVTQKCDSINDFLQALIES